MVFYKQELLRGLEALCDLHTVWTVVEQIRKGAKDTGCVRIMTTPKFFVIYSFLQNGRMVSYN